jgi:hypothetical protein
MYVIIIIIISWEPKGETKLAFRGIPMLSLSLSLSHHEWFSIEFHLLFKITQISSLNICEILSWVVIVIWKFLWSIASSNIWGFNSHSKAEVVKGVVSKEVLLQQAQNVHNMMMGPKCVWVSTIFFEKKGWLGQARADKGEEEKRKKKEIMWYKSVACNKDQ